jgi:hypothetical protein
MFSLLEVTSKFHIFTVLQIDDLQVICHIICRYVHDPSLYICLDPKNSLVIAIKTKV